jgi:pimeloyl-ACP methyl ester carboxylesterase
LRREAGDPTFLLGDAIDFPLFRDLCDACPGSTLEDAFRGDVAANAPVLFVSGTLDARTPPENVEAIRASLPNAVHVVVENAGHESRELMSPEYRRLLQAFLRGESVVDGRVVLPQPRWEGLAD